MNSGMIAQIIMILIFFAVTIGIGIYCRKKATNVGDFVLGGREVGPWLTAFAYGTSYFSAVVFIGYAGQFGWQFGMAATWIGIGNALVGSLLAWVVLGRRTRVMTKHLNSSTMPEFFARRYNSRALKLFASVVIFIFLIPYSASIYKGLSGLFEIAFNIDFNICLIIMAVITGIYVVVGGYMATAINDFIQGIIMLIGIVAVIAAVLRVNGGFTDTVVLLSQFAADNNPSFHGAYTSMFGPSFTDLLSVFILTSVGTWGLPQMVHKFYAIKSEKAIHTGTIISTLFALVIAGGSYFLGGFGRLFYTPDASGAVKYDRIVPGMLETSLGPIMIGIVLILVLSASMSTLSSLVITSSSTVILDFINAFRKKDKSEKRKKQDLLFIRIMCALFVALSVIIAIIPNQLITALMSLSWGALAGAFLGPLFYGLFWKRTTKGSVWACMIVGILIVVVNYFGGFVSPLMAGAISILMSFVTVPVVSLFTPKMSYDYVNIVFSCYDEKVTTEAKTVLVEEEF